MASTTATLPFAVASRVATRQAFSSGPTTLGAAPITLNPIPIPAVGYLRSILLDVTITASGGTSPAFLADAPFNALQIVNFRTASGNDIITPITGYQLYQINKFGGYRPINSNDARNPGAGYSANIASGAHFILRVPLEVDSQTGFCALPALAGNRPYMLNITLAPLALVASGSPTLSVSINGYSEFWLEPTANTKSGAQQETQPLGLGSVSKWEQEVPSVNPGNRLIKLNNVGNTLRTLIFTARNSSGARIGAGNGFPSSGEIQFYVDNEMLFAITPTMWQQYMSEWYGYTSGSADVYSGMDTGVYVLPFHALLGDSAGDPTNTRSQLLPTLNASQVQIQATFGSQISTLEILTNSIVPVTGTGYTALFSK